MKKQYILLGFIVWLLGAVAIGSGALFGTDTDSWVTKVQAAKKQSEIDSLTDSKEELEEKKRKIEEKLSDLESKKEDLTAYIKDCDKNAGELQAEIRENEKEIERLENDIDSLEKREADLQEKLETQYESMKIRIKYIYENGEDNYLDLIMGSVSMSELYNHIEYVTKMNEYDANIIIRYGKSKDKLTEIKSKKETKRNSVEVKRNKLEYEEQALETVISKKKAQLEKYSEQIQDSEADISAYDSEIKQKEQELENLMASEREENDAQEDAGGTDDTNVPAGNSTSGFGWPLGVSGRISCGFGPRKAPTKGASTYHKGIDIAVPTGTSVKAAKAGTVVTSTYSSSGGNLISISHGNGVYTYYMHNSKRKVNVGDHVKKGQEIALSGSTGISTGPHLHFALFMGGKYVNPLSYVSR